MKFKLSIIALLVLFVASCSTITPSPDFTVTELPKLATDVTAGTTEITIPPIIIENNTSVETVIYSSTYQYIKDGTIIAECDEFITMSALLPANKTVEGVLVKGELELTSFLYPFPSEVWTAMIDNDWEGVTLRVFLTGRDNYGYNKTFTTSFDYGCVRLAK